MRSLQALHPDADHLAQRSGNIVHQHRVALVLAAAAGVAGGVSALAGFIPGLYRDPTVVVQQSRGYDLGNLCVVAVLELALASAAHGSLRGRLVAVGALGCLFYSFVTYAFMIVLNPATVLYIAVVGLAGWSFLAGIANIDELQVENLIGPRLARRTTAAFLLILAVVFGVTWLTQLIGSAYSGILPPDLATSGWPMNPVYVLDLGFVVPLALLTAWRLTYQSSGCARIAVPFLVFDALLATSILLMAVVAWMAGQPAQVPMLAIFAVNLVVATALSVRALLP